MKKQYLVSLSSSDSTLENMAIAAAKSNAILTNFTIDELAGFYYTRKILYPTLHQNQELHNLGDTLTVDETINGVTTCLLIIESIEVKTEDDGND